MTISVLVPCFNNADIIEECLRSVRWADELVVVDSFSNDGTIDIAKRYADRVLQHEYRNSAQQKNWAIPQLSHLWVLIVDSDERVTPELQAEIQQAVDESGDAVGFRIPRANFLFGRQLRHGQEWPDHQIRLFRRDCGRYEDREVHAHIVLEGPAGTLNQSLLHFPHRSLSDLRRVILRRYSRWEAMEKDKQGIRFRGSQLWIRPSAAFVQRYLLQKGFLDGWQGLLMAVIWSWYVFFSYWNLRALQTPSR